MSKVKTASNATTATAVAACFAVVLCGAFATGFVVSHHAKPAHAPIVAYEVPQVSDSALAHPVITIVGIPGCRYCELAKQWANDTPGLLWSYETYNPQVHTWLKRRTFPVIVDYQADVPVYWHISSRKQFDDAIYGRD